MRTEGWNGDVGVADRQTWGVAWTDGRRHEWLSIVRHTLQKHARAQGEATAGIQHIDIDATHTTDLQSDACEETTPLKVLLKEALAIGISLHKSGRGNICIWNTQLHGQPE